MIHETNTVQLALTIIVPNIPAGQSNNKTIDLWDDLDDECVNALNNYEGKIFCL